MFKLNKLDTSNLRGDLLGGLTAAIVSLPLALAFGVASGAGAEAGIYGAVMVGLFASLFGGTPTLISEPTGPMTVSMVTVVTSMLAANPENGMAMAFTLLLFRVCIRWFLRMRARHFSSVPLYIQEIYRCLWYNIIVL